MEAEHKREQRRRLTTDDFDPLVIIGRGAFGEVGAREGGREGGEGGYSCAFVHGFAEKH
jgi:hypothetical protein